MLACDCNCVVSKKHPINFFPLITRHVHVSFDTGNQIAKVHSFDYVNMNYDGLRNYSHEQFQVPISDFHLIALAEDLLDMGSDAHFIDSEKDFEGNIIAAMKLNGLDEIIESISTTLYPRANHAKAQQPLSEGAKVEVEIKGITEERKQELFLFLKQAISNIYTMCDLVPVPPYSNGYLRNVLFPFSLEHLKYFYPQIYTVFFTSHSTKDLFKRIIDPDSKYTDEDNPEEEVLHRSNLKESDNEELLMENDEKDEEEEETAVDENHDIVNNESPNENGQNGFFPSNFYWAPMEDTFLSYYNHFDGIFRGTLQDYFIET